jgi:hypothetical protein
MPIVRQNLTDKFKHIIADTRYNVLVYTLQT